MNIRALNIDWPDTGRTFPPGAKLEAHVIDEPWLDLVWLNGRGEWQYVSTVPACQICDGKGWYATQEGTSLPWEAEQRQCDACCGTGQANKTTTT